MTPLKQPAPLLNSAKEVGSDPIKRPAPLHHSAGEVGSDTA